MPAHEVARPLPPGRVVRLLTWTLAPLPELMQSHDVEVSEDGEARVVSENGRRDVEQWRRTRVEAPWMRGCLK